MRHEKRMRWSRSARVGTCPVCCPAASHNEQLDPHNAQLLVQCWTRSLGRRDSWCTLGLRIATPGAPWDTTSNSWCTLGRKWPHFCPGVHQELLFLSWVAPSVADPRLKSHQQTRARVPRCATSCGPGACHVPNCTRSCGRYPEVRHQLPRNCRG